MTDTPRALLEAAMFEMPTLHLDPEAFAATPSGARLLALAADARRLREALEFIADWADDCDDDDPPLYGFVDISLHARAALAAPPAVSPPRDEGPAMPPGASLAWHVEPHSPGGICWGCSSHVGWHMEACGCKEAPWCVPHPSEGIHQWRSICRDHEHVAAPTTEAP